MKYLLSLCLCLMAKKAVSNDSVLIMQLLKKIEQLQVKDKGIFPKGSIPSYRKYAHNPDRYKADINPFFTGLTAFTLLKIRDGFTDNQKLVADTIIQRAKSTYSKFENKKKNGLTYNFWPTDTLQIFPNSGWLNLFNKTRALPDDMDDTVIILMALEAQSSTAKAVHQLMQKHANTVTKTAHNTFDEYKNLAAYSTWFGKKMAIELDICVLSNILYFVQQYQLDWTASDTASLTLIANAINSNQHINSAKFISPQYATTPLILYHVSRLMALKPIEQLEKLKPNMINQALAVFNNSSNFMEKVILSTALFRMGHKPPVIEVNDKTPLDKLVEDESFVFFIANMGSIYPDKIKKFLTNSKLGTFYYYSPGYNYLLLLENLILQKKHSKL